MSVSTPDICDQYQELVHVVEPVLRNFGKKRRFAGRIVTIKCYEDNSRVKETLNTHGAGKVLVVDGGGSMRRALLGDQLAALAAEKGWEGVLVNGCVRDVEMLADIDLGIRALNCHPVRSNKRGQGQVDAPVRFAGVTFRSGQYLYADATGVVVADSELGVDFA